MLDRDPMPLPTWPDLAPPPALSEVPGQGRIEPIVLVPLVDDPWTMALKAAGTPESRAVAPDDDCAPEPHRPAAIGRAPLAEAAGKPIKRSFSEQLDAAKKRFRPPVVIRTPARDC